MSAHAQDPGAARRERDTRRVLGVLLAAALAGPIRTGWTRYPPGPPRAGADPAPVTVDVGRDPAWRLMLLPGIGRMRAVEIVRDRLRNGPPIVLEDLRRVPGIGAGTVERIASTPGLRIRIEGRPVGCRDEREPPAPR